MPQLPSLKYQWRLLRNKLKRNKIGRLPVELYLLIIEQVERQGDLYNLLLVCRDFHAVAERVLYRDVHINDGEDLRLFQTIISFERLACQIQFLTISSPWFQRHDISFEKSYWDTLCQVVRATRNLKGFFWLTNRAIDTGRSHHCEIPNTYLFSGCTFELHTLVFHTSFRHNVILDRAFLNLQTKLVVLDISHLAFHPNAFPKLTALAVATPETAQLVHRPTLRALRLTYPLQSFNTDRWPSSTLLTSLRLRFQSSSENFARILQAYPCLRFLHIEQIDMTSLRTVRSFRSLPLPLNLYLGQGMLIYMFDRIAHLSTLEKLILHFGYWAGQPDAMSLRDMAFNRLRNLQVIVFEEDFRPYFQMRRGGSEKEITGPSDEEWRDNRWL